MGIRRSDVKKVLKLTRDLNVLALEYYMSKFCGGRSKKLNRRFCEHWKTLDKRLAIIMASTNI